jgi:hypothetical protein
MNPQSPSRPRSAAPATGSLRHSGHRRLRFPCGHTDGEAGVAWRLRTRPRALWVPCSRCNVVALIVATIGRT